MILIQLPSMVSIPKLLKVELLAVLWINMSELKYSFKKGYKISLLVFSYTCFNRNLSNYLSSKYIDNGKLL